MGLYLGIDMGTSSVKTTLVDEHGCVLKSAESTLHISCPHPGWKEIDPELWWIATRKSILKLLAGELLDGESHADKQDTGQFPAGGCSTENGCSAGGQNGAHRRCIADIQGIGVTGQMHTTVFLDREGTSLRPAIMWNDTRSAQLLEGLRERYDRAGLFELSRTLSTGSPAANLAWLREEEPEAFSRLSTFLIGPNWLVFRLTGTRSTDFCEASTSSLYDLASCTWSEPAREILGLSKHQYPKVYGAAHVAGTLKPDVARELGLPRNAKVVVGTGDNPAAALPVGVLTSKQPMVSLGTSGILIFSREKPLYDLPGKNILFSLDGCVCTTLVQGAIQSCGSSLSWIMKTILREEGFLGVDHALAQAHALEDTPLFFPHLSGDKTLYADPSLRGSFVGLCSDTTRACLVRSVVEGISFAFRQLTEEMGIELEGWSCLPVAGGGSRSDAWMQMLADILHVETCRLSGVAGAGLGAALLAALACGEFTTQELTRYAAHTLNTCTGKHFIPESRSVALENKRYANYLRMHDALVSIWTEDT